MRTRSIANRAQWLWEAGRNTMEIAEALQWHWPALPPKKVEPIICRLLCKAREEQRKGRVA